MVPKRNISLVMLLVMLSYVYSESVELKFLSKTGGYQIYNQKAVLCGGTSCDTLKKNVICKFAVNDTLYIISNIIKKDYEELTATEDNVGILIDKLMSIYYDEGTCEGDGCGYFIKYDGYTPNTLTLCSILDTIQYTTTPTPNFYAASIMDTLYHSTNIKCGMPMQDLLRRLSINYISRECEKYKTIVLLSTDYSIYQDNSYIELPEICIILKHQNHILKKIELKQTRYYGIHIVDSHSFYKMSCNELFP